MKLRINLKTLYCLWCFVPFVSLASYLMPDAVNTLIRLWRMMVILLAACKYIKHRLLTMADLCLFACQLVVLLSTIINRGEVQNQLLRFIYVVGFIMMIKMCLHYDAKALFQAIAFYGGMLSFFTAVTMFIYYRPGEYVGGMYRAGQVMEYGRRISGNYYLLGLDNVSFFYLFPMLMIMYLYYYIYKQKVSVLFVFIYAFVSIAFIYVRSASASTCFVIMGVLLFVCTKPRYFHSLIRSINYRKALIIVFVFLIFVVFLRFHYYVSDLITSVFKKSVTLTRRTEIWDTALMQIPRHWCIGVGAQSDAYNYTLFRVNHVHNIVLELLYEGGVLALSSFIVAVVLYGRKVSKFRTNTISVLLSGAVIIYFICACFDFYLYQYTPYSILILCEAVHRLTKEYNKEQIRRKLQLKQLY